jgi:uncharacterized protein YndB with AHSA1/START domain
MTYESRTISVAIARPPGEVYDFASVPENLPRWASGLGTAGARDGADWVSRMEVGTVRVRLVPRNTLGVLDHDVTLPDGTVVTNPMRVVPNGAGSEVSFTLFRRPEMTGEMFEADAATVRADLHTLKRLLER